MVAALGRQLQAAQQMLCHLRVGSNSTKITKIKRGIFNCRVQVNAARDDEAICRLPEYKYFDP